MTKCPVNIASDNLIEVMKEMGRSVVSLKELAEYLEKRNGKSTVHPK